MKTLMVLLEGLTEFAGRQHLHATSALLQSLGATVHSRAEELFKEQGTASTAQQGRSQAGGASSMSRPATTVYEQPKEGQRHVTGGGDARDVRKSMPLPDTVSRHETVTSDKQCQDSTMSAPAGDLKRQVHPSSTSPSFRQAAKAMLTGFRPAATEQGYMSWVGAQCSAHTWSFVYLAWLVIVIIRSAREGVPVLMAHLPSHLIVGAPYAVSLVLAATGQYR
jgi:hypothetical protein